MKCLFSLAQTGIHDHSIIPEMSDVCLSDGADVQSNAHVSWTLHRSFLQASATQVSDSRPKHTATTDRCLLLFRITGGQMEGWRKEGMQGLFLMGFFVFTKKIWDHKKRSMSSEKFRFKKISKTLNTHKIKQ